MSFYRRVIGALARIAKEVCMNKTTIDTTSAQGAQAYRSRQKTNSQTLTTYDPQTTRLTVHYFVIAETQPGMAKASEAGQYQILVYGIQEVDTDELTSSNDSFTRVPI